MYYPEAEIDGVELDPAVSRVGRRYFGMDENPRLTVHDVDARPFLRSTDETFDLIVVDAYRQPYVPFYLATREFFALVREHLRPGGIVALNVAAVPEDKRLVRAVGGTLAAEFPQVLEWPALRFNTIVLGLTEPLTAAEIDRRLSSGPPDLASIRELLARDVRPVEASECAVDGRPRTRRVADGSHDRVVRGRGRQARGGLPPDEAAAVISLERRGGRPLRIGHRGAASLGPANTLASFRSALETGVDLIEFDVCTDGDGRLVVAHSLREIQPETPTLDAVLAFFAEEARDVGVHLDLKQFGRESEVVDALRRFGLLERSFVSSVYVRTARRIAEFSGVRSGITIPRAVLGISDDGRGAPIARSGLRLLRFVTPLLVRPLLWLTRSSAVVMHHSIVTRASVRAAHARGAAVVTWTVDDAAELARVDDAGVDAIVTNDPRLFPSN